MVSRALNLCGLYLGEKEQLRRFSDHNVEGYWENDDFVELNERLLAALDGGWDLPFPEVPGWEERPALQPLRQDASRLLDWFASREPWGWKDPRNALLLPFWKSVIPGLRFVVCLRHPVEVAQSLSQRGRSSLRFGLWLWEEYYRRILAYTSADERIVIHYATCLDEPEQECGRLAAFAELTASEDAVRSMKPQLRHQRAATDVPAPIALPPQVQAFYDALRQEAAIAPAPPPTRPAQAAVEPELETTMRVDLSGDAPVVIRRDVQPRAVAMEGMTYEAASNDPQFELTLPPFASSSVRAVRFRMRRESTQSAVAQLFWTHALDEDFSERKSTTVFLEPAAAGWSEYRFRLDRPLVRERWLEGDAIVRLRFDPADGAGRFELGDLLLES